MAASFTCSRIIALPPAPQGWHVVDYMPLRDGSLACLQATTDIVATNQSNDALFAKGLYDGWKPLFSAGDRARILRVGENDPAAEFMLEYPFLSFDCLPDGGWIVVNGRCERGAPPNAMRLNKHGELLARFQVGDGVGHIQADDVGGLWVGYFDEGINGDDLGSAGIAYFDGFGRQAWRANYDQPIPFVDDCYALNAVGAEAWACYYSDFPILRIRRNGEARFWSNGVNGAAAIAVDGDRVVLYGGYAEDASRIALLKLGEKAAAWIGELTLAGPKMVRGQVVGRGDTIHLIGDGTWGRFTVVDIVAAVAEAGEAATPSWDD